MIAAIETEYQGYRFRSRLEARWAVFFDALALRWEYEKEGFELGKLGRYLPDFWLPDLHLRGYGAGVWVEIKGQSPTDDETAKCEALQGNSVIFCGLPPGDEWEGGYQCSPFFDNCMVFMRCYSCGTTKIEFNDSNYMHCPKCHQLAGDMHPAIKYAAQAAKAARYEHGERR